jgi:hypothetical protein
LTVVFEVVMKMKIVREKLLCKLQKITRRHQKVRKVMRMTRPSVKEGLDRMQGNLLFN